MYRPGTLVTLKDGRVYRTSKKMAWPCCKCMNFYASSYTPTPCSQTYSEQPFGYNTAWPNRKECAKLYGNKQFPKLVTLCGSQVKS